MAAITQAVKTIAGLFARPFAAVHAVLFGTKRTCRDVCYLSAFGGKADISPAIANPIMIYEYAP